MSALLAVDPGINGCGVAEFYKGRLNRAAYVKNTCSPKESLAARAAEMAHNVCCWADFYERPGDLALEWPRVYASRIRESRTKADPNDLLALCGVQAAVVALCGAYGTAACYAPSDWKRNLPKTACEIRVRIRLDEFEREILERAKSPPSLLHNVIDAVGIGLHHLGRKLV